MMEMGVLLERWRMDEAEVQTADVSGSDARERERWHALWLLARGWTAAAVARRWERDAHTIGQWAEAFSEGGPRRWLLSSREVPPRAEREQQAELKAAVRELPSQAGIELSNWNWKAVRRRCGNASGWY